MDVVALPDELPDCARDKARKFAPRGVIRADSESIKGASSGILLYGALNMFWTSVWNDAYPHAKRG